MSQSPPRKASPSTDLSTLSLGSSPGSTVLSESRSPPPTYLPQPSSLSSTSTPAPSSEENSEENEEEKTPKKPTSAKELSVLTSRIKPIKSKPNSASSSSTALQKKRISSSCLAGKVIALGVSINADSNNHEGEHLAAMVDFINQSICKFAYIVVGDGYLLAPNYAIDKNLDIKSPNQQELSNAYQEALQAGENWEQRNLPILEGIKVPHKIIHWNDILGHPSYRDVYDQLQTLYIADKDVQQGINNSIEEFFKRHHKRLQSSSLTFPPAEKNVRDWSREYIIRESVGLLKILQLMRTDFVIYPGPELEALRVIRPHLLQGQESELVKWVELDFNRVKIRPSNEKDLVNTAAYVFKGQDRLSPITSNTPSTSYTLSQPIPIPPSKENTLPSSLMLYLLRQQQLQQQQQQLQNEFLMSLIQSQSPPKTLPPFTSHSSVSFFQLQTTPFSSIPSCSGSASTPGVTQ